MKALKIKTLLLPLLSALLLVTLPAARAADSSKEYLVKAAFIYNFIKFTEWPGERAPTHTKNVNICVVGANPFGAAASVFNEASTPALSLTLKEESNLHAVSTNCHIAFISDSEKARANEVIAALRQSPVLTISDIDDFAGKGGIIGFVLQDGKIKLIVNNRAAQAAGLRIDAQLLEIALSVIH